MFRSMRRSRQELDKQECERILSEVSYGVLSLPGAEGYPYGVPMNFVYEDGRIYLHGARIGLRADSVGSGCRACFTVVEKWDVDAPSLSTLYRSVIAFGELRPTTPGEETERAAMRLGLRYLDDEAAVKAEVEREKKALRCFVLDIEHMTGKDSKALAAKRRENHD